MHSSWVWGALILASAGAQTIRNAAQRTLARSSGVLPATLVRFCHGIPFSAAGLVVIVVANPGSLPTPDAAYISWIGLGAISQLAATVCLIAAMGKRSFVVAMAYSKSEILQVGLFSTMILAEPLTFAMVVAVVVSTAGILALSVEWNAMPRALGKSWLSAGAALGLGSGAGYALSGVGFRGAMLALDHPTPWIAGIYSVVWAQAIQTLLLGLFLVLLDRRGLAKAIANWRVSTLAGAAGSLASMGWLTAYAMRSAVEVSVASLVDVLFSYGVSRFIFKEPVSRTEIVGMVLVTIGVGMTLFSIE